MTTGTEGNSITNDQWANTVIRQNNYGTHLLIPLETYVSEAINQHAGQDEMIGYAVSLTVVPGQAPGQFVPVIVIVLTAESPDGVPSYATSLSMDLHQSRAAVQEVVASLFEQIRSGSTGERV
jgi:hypothetical protein